jgi:hypothetical protein
MAYPASLLLETSGLDTNGGRFDFLTAVTPNGSPLVEALHQEEELIVFGVNGRRWRTIYDQYEPFTMETSADTTSYTTAVTIREYYRLCRGRFAVLSLTASDYSSRFRVHVMEVNARCMPGRTVGANVTASAIAVIVCTWTLVRVAE